MTDENSRIKRNWRGSALHFSGFILLPVLIVIAIVLYILDIPATYGSTLLFQVLTYIFSTGCSLIIAFFAVRTYVFTSTWRVLFLGGGALAFGVASLLAGWLLTASFNLAVTVSNFGVLLAATLHLLGAIQNPNKNMVANETQKLSNGTIAILFCSGIAAFFILISMATSNGLFPAFYVSGEGYTLIRYIFSAFYVVFLIASAALYARLYVSSKSDFVYWYSLGLAMIALGLVAGFLGSPGDPLNWLGRIAQYGGSIYFVVAVVVTRNEARNKQKPVSQMLSEILTETQAKLRESEQRWSTTLSSIGDAVIATDTAGRITFMNPVAEKMTGWNLKEAAKKPVTEVFNIINEQTRQKVVNPAEKVLQYGMIVSLANHTVLVRKDGTEVSIDDSGAPIQGADGKITGVVLVFRDITERKKAEEALDRERGQLRAVIESLDEAVGVWNTDGSLVLINDATAKLYGFEIKEQMLKHLSDYADVQVRTMDGRELPQEEWPPSRVLRGETFSNWELEQYIPSINKRFIGSNSGRPVRDANGKIILGVTSVRDITERKKAEEALKRYTAELEAANKELESYSYSISHDLRTPLRTLDGFSEMVIMEYGDKLDETGKDYLNRIRKAGQTMSQLTEDILKLSRITRSEMHKGRVNLSEMTASIADELKALHPERQAEFIIAPDIIVNGDKALLEILLRNLLENSWKYTSKCPDTRIEMGVNLKDGKIVYFIKDNGVGFDMKYYDKLFQPFQRLHTSKDYPGTGIGLATAARVIHRHSGKIWAESEIRQRDYLLLYFGLKINRPIQIRTQQLQ